MFINNIYNMTSDIQVTLQYQLQTEVVTIKQQNLTFDNLLSNLN